MAVGGGDGQLNAPTTLPLMVRAHGVLWIGGWVGHRGSLDMVARRKNLLSQELNKKLIRAKERLFLYVDIIIVTLFAMLQLVTMWPTLHLQPQMETVLLIHITREDPDQLPVCVGLWMI